MCADDADCIMSIGPLAALPIGHWCMLPSSLIIDHYGRIMMTVDSPEWLSMALSPVSPEF